MLTVESRPNEPEDIDLAPWDEVSEISLALVGSELGVYTDTHEDEEAPDPGFPDFTTLGTGPYRVRVHARGRDAASWGGALCRRTSHHGMACGMPQGH